MKKICFITTNLYPVPAVKGGAIEGIMTDIINQQEKNPQFEMTMVSLYDPIAYQESKKYKNTNFIYIKKNIKYIFTSIFYKLINKLLKKNLNTYNHCVLSKIKNIDFNYVVAEGGHYESYIEFLKYFKREQLLIHLHHQQHSNKIIDYTFSGIIGVSQFVLDDFKKTSEIKNYFLLKNCVEINKFVRNTSVEETNQLKNKFNLKKNDFVVIFCGRLIKEKGVLELIRAIKKINDERFKLLIVGVVNFANGGHTEYTKLLNDEISGYEQQIMFTGFVNNSELYKYYQLADIMAIPSLGKEAAGLVCIEGMLCEKTILTTGIGGIKEYVNKETEFVKINKRIVSSLADKIIELSKDKQKLSEIGKRARLDALKFSSENYYQKLSDIINKEWR